MSSLSVLFPSLEAPVPQPDKPALTWDEVTLTYADLAAAVDVVAAGLRATAEADAPTGRPFRALVWATPTPHTAVATVGALRAGVPAVPINPKAGSRELAHIVGDCDPALVLAERDVELPEELGALPRLEAPTAPTAGSTHPCAEPGAESPALIVYTSGTTGPPKGVVLPRRAIAATLDAVADAWAWTERDVLVHGLPLFHVHGLILGVLGPLRRGGTLRHLGRFTPEAAAGAVADGATMLFGVPTMYHRLAEAAEQDATVAAALGSARLLVSGSAALPAYEHRRITAATGQQVVERYGMSETLMNTSVRVDGVRRPGTVGVPLPGVELRLVDDAGAELPEIDDESVGEIQVKGPNLFTEYLNRPDATAEAHDGDWFRTGDMAIRDADGYVRIVGRKSTDVIKSGGYKIGAGEIENALLEHPAVAEVAVTAEPDPDLGERIVAWVVVAEDAAKPADQELADHVARLLTPHKRPRVVRYVDALPRNDMGKILKRALTEPSA